MNDTPHGPSERLEFLRLRDELLSSVGHELRTPLTCIHGTLELLRGGVLGNVSEAGSRLLDRAILSSTRLSRLVDRMLDVNRLKSGRLALSKTQCRLPDLAARAVEHVRLVAESRHVTIHLTTAEDRLWADADRIVEVLDSVLDNAVRFSPEGGDVSLSIRRDDNFVLFTVEDHGVGIPPEHLEAIFENFGQLDQSNTRTPGGTGLGLPLSRHLVRQHGGRMWAESKPGLGSVFHFILPAPQEQSLIDNIESIRMLVEHVNDVLWMEDCATHQVVYVSPAYEVLWGRSRESLYADPGAWLQGIHEDDRDRVRQAAHQQMDGSYRVEFRVVSGVGSMRWVRARSYPVRNEFGAVTHLVGIAEDFSATREAQEQLQTLNAELEERVQERTAALSSQRLQFESLFNANPEAIIYVDRQRRIQSCNPAFARLFGFRSEAMVGQSTRSLYASDQSFDEVGRSFQSLTDCDATVTCQIHYRRQDRTEFPAEMVVSRVVDDRGDSTGYLGIIRDLTARRLLEDQFRQAQKMDAVGQLAGGVAHDFNNLLTVITGYTAMLEVDMDLHDPRREMLEEIAKAAEKAAAVTSQLLTFSRHHVVKTEVVDTRTVVDGCRKLIQRLIGEDLDFRVGQSADPLCVSADRGQLEQILMNLAVNARDAMPGGGTLDLRIAAVTLETPLALTTTVLAPGAYVEISMSDTGTGMDADTVARLFEPFFTTKPVGKGTGLGLATVYGIVTQGQGGILVQSTRHHGTTFKIYLPRVSADLMVPRVRASRHPSPTQDETILVVEDEASVRRLITRALQGQGYEVLEAPDGETGLSMMSHHEPHVDLLVTDIVMPRMGGIPLAEQVHAMHPKCRILLLSGYLDDRIAHADLQRPEVNFLRKPLNLATFVQKVRDILDRLAPTVRQVEPRAADLQRVTGWYEMLVVG